MSFTLQPQAPDPDIVCWFQCELFDTDVTCLYFNHVFYPLTYQNLVYTQTNWIYIRRVFPPMLFHPHDFAKAHDLPTRASWSWGILALHVSSILLPREHKRPSGAPFPKHLGSRWVRWCQSTYPTTPITVPLGNAEKRWFDFIPGHIKRKPIWDFIGPDHEAGWNLGGINVRGRLD